MLVSDKHKIVFVAIPKTGTRSIYKALEDHFSGQVYSDHLKIIPKQFRGYYSFCVVRNPYERAVSIWWSTCKRNNDKRHFISKYLRNNNTFENFAKNIHLINEIEKRAVTDYQYKWIEQNNIDRMLRFEDLQGEFNSLPFVRKKIELPLLNPTTEITKGNPVIRKAYGNYITTDSIYYINEYYARDFEICGYDMIRP